MSKIRTFTRARFRVLALVLAALVALPIAGATAAAAQGQTASPTAASRTAATAQKQAADTGATPVGAWSLQVSFTGGSFTSGVRFTPKGRAFLIAPHDGSGTWRQTGENDFTWQIAEPTLDASGNFTGWTHIHQNSVLNGAGNTFSGIGPSRQYDTNDQLLFTVQSQVDGTLIPSTP
jgi:hypothetical protein